MAKFPSKGQRAFDSKRPGSGAGKAMTKVRRISAPTPPATASMKGMGGKLRKGD